MTRVVIASSSQLSADAGARVAADGGNAVDAAIAASLVSISTEPGVCSVGATGFVSVWPTDGEPLTIDGSAEMPGRGVAPDRIGGGTREANMDYGGGVTTIVGHGSVATPGALAAYDHASRRYGRAPWRELLQPAIEHAHDGFPLPQASYDYLIHSHESVYGWDPNSHAALHDQTGRLRECGDTIVIEHLADALDTIARDGVAAFYQGDIAALIATDIEAHGGILSRRDLAEYRSIARAPLRLNFAGWNLATNPPPAVGGVTLAAMLALYEPAGKDHDIRDIIAVQEAVLRYRQTHLDLSDDLGGEARRLLARIGRGNFPLARSSSATVHTSAVDQDGLACAITMSSGYGAGVMPPGTGIWLNNCLGELELNRKGLFSAPTGTRLSSNMAPTVAAHSDGRRLAIGSPGADRITSAMFQTLVGFAVSDMKLVDAILQPRVHVEVIGERIQVAYESALDLATLELPSRSFDGLSMYFGGVGAALWERRNDFQVAADPRRRGGKARA